MMNKSVNEKLTNILMEAITFLGDNSKVMVFNSLMDDDIAKLNIVILVSESSKAILTALITLLFYKILHPNQDIRNHQASIPNGFSGRTFDTQIITPFTKLHRFPAMFESVGLTRSLEQNAHIHLIILAKLPQQRQKLLFWDCCIRLRKTPYHQKIVCCIFFKS